MRYKEDRHSGKIQQSQWLQRLRPWMHMDRASLHPHTWRETGSLWRNLFCFGGSNGSVWTNGSVWRLRDTRKHKIHYEMIAQGFLLTFGVGNGEGGSMWKAEGKSKSFKSEWKKNYGGYEMTISNRLKTNKGNDIRGKAVYTQKIHTKKA